MNKSDFIKKFWEIDRKVYLETDLKITKEVILSYVTEDFIVTNLQDNSIIGQGVDYALKATEIEIEKKLVFNICESISAGDFEVSRYEVTNANGEKGGGTLIYRFRDNKISEMILLDHD